MRNNIDFFGDPWDGSDMPRPFIPMVFSCVGFIVFGVMSIPPVCWAPYSVVFFALSTIIFIAMVVGVRTHYSRNLSAAESDTFNSYNKLSSENKKAIGFSPKDFDGMYDVNAVRINIEKLLDVQNKRAEYAMQIDGRNNERIRRLQERVESEQQALQIDAEIVKELM